MFFWVRVCLYFQLSLQINLKKLWMDFDEIFKKSLQWHKGHIIRILWSSGSLPGSSDYLKDF